MLKVFWVDNFISRFLFVRVFSSKHVKKCSTLLMFIIVSSLTVFFAPATATVPNQEPWCETLGNRLKKLTPTTMIWEWEYTLQNTPRRPGLHLYGCRALYPAEQGVTWRSFFPLPVRVDLENERRKEEEYSRSLSANTLLCRVLEPHLNLIAYEILSKGEENFHAEFDEDRVYCRGFGKTLISMRDRPQQLLSPTNIRPTATTRKLVMNLAKEEYRQPKIWDQIVTELQLTPEVIKSSPELKALLREAEAVATQVKADD